MFPRQHLLDAGWDESALLFAGIDQLVDRCFAGSHHSFEIVTMSTHVGMMLFYKLSIMRLDHFLRDDFVEVKSENCSPIF